MPVGPAAALIAWFSGMAFASTDGLVGPVSVHLSAGGQANYWAPRYIPGAKFETRGYSTAWFNARALLWDRIDLHRVRWETTAGDPPRVATGARAIERATGSRVMARAFDALGTVYVGETSDGAPIGPAARYRHEVYNGRLAFFEDAVLFHDHMGSGDSAIPVPDGYDLRFDTEFTQVLVGATWSEERDDARHQTTAGISSLTFRKPWTLSTQVEETGENFAIVSDFGGWGIGALYSLESEGDGPMLSGEAFLGAGSVKVGEDLYLQEMLDEDYGLYCIAGGGQAGYRKVIVDRRVRLAAEGSAGADLDWFFVSEKEEDADDDETVTLTYDLRLHVSARVVAMF